MKNACGLIAFFLFSLIACQSSVKPEKSEQEAITSLAQQYAQAFASNSPDAILNCVTDDFVAIAPDKPPVVGKNAVKAAISKDLSEMEVVALRFEPDEIFTTGNWGFARGSSSATIKMKADGQISQLKGKFLWILRKEKPGGWKVARDSSFGDEQPK